MKHAHILGICGTFMASLAHLLQQQGVTVTGQDQNVYPPMSTQLQALNIKIIPGYEVKDIPSEADTIIAGNVMRRGMPIIEALMARKVTLYSGPDILRRFILQDKTVLAVAGTHGKTSTTSMLAWILAEAGLNPGFLIGGQPNNFECSAHIGGGRYFVIEADEYDTAFFDKRAKFCHYYPDIFVLNNLEFDHGDIYRDLASIQQQFHHGLRLVPPQGSVIYWPSQPNVQATVEMGLWSRAVTMGTSQDQWYFEENRLHFQQQDVGCLNWSLIGEHNQANALAAIAAANTVGVKPEKALSALQSFNGVKRRMEVVAESPHAKVYDDFAHHPTAIAETLKALRQSIGKGQMIALVDIRSNTMAKGDHQRRLASAVKDADQVYFYHERPLEFDLETVFNLTQKPGGIFQDISALQAAVTERLTSDFTHIICMSNGAFGGISNKLLVSDFSTEC